MELERREWVLPAESELRCEVPPDATLTVQVSIIPLTRNNGCVFVKPKIVHAIIALCANAAAGGQR
jgi:hypothetical protein